MQHIASWVKLLGIEHRSQVSGMKAGYVKAICLTSGWFFLEGLFVSQIEIGDIPTQVMMMYKIMGLNSVMSAFAMSALTLDGVKLGDGQTAIESLLLCQMRSNALQICANHISFVFCYNVVQGFSRLLLLTYSHVSKELNH